MAVKTLNSGIQKNNKQTIFEDNFTALNNLF